MTRKSIPLIVFFVVCVVPAMAIGASLEGTIQGFNCVTQGKACPDCAEDPLVITESAFVLQTQGSEYFFLPNIDRALLTKQLNKRVKVEGDRKSEFNSIKAKDLYVKVDSKWKKVWSSNRRDDIYRSWDGFNNDPSRGR